MIANAPRTCFLPETNRAQAGCCLYQHSTESQLPIPCGKANDSSRVPPSTTPASNRRRHLPARPPIPGASNIARHNSEIQGRPYSARSITPVNRPQSERLDRAPHSPAILSRQPSRLPIFLLVTIAPTRFCHPRKKCIATIPYGRVERRASFLGG